MISVSTCDNGSEHDGFVRLVLEVSIPELIEFRPHFFQFFFGGTNLTQKLAVISIGSQLFWGLTLNPASITLEDNRAFSGDVSHSLYN